MFDRKRFLEIRRQSFERRLRARSCDSGLEPAYDDQLLPGPIAECRFARLLEIVRDPVVIAERHPDFDRKNLQRPGETARRDPDNRKRMAVDEQVRTEHGWIEIMLLPIGVADDGNWSVAADRFLLWRERAAARQWNAENREITRADDRAESPPRVAFLAEPDHRKVVRHHVGENSILGANVLVSRVGKAAIRFRILFVL